MPDFAAVSFQADSRKSPSEPVHTPVLVEECISLLEPHEPEGDALFVDATQGEGGHSFAFLSRFPGLRVIGIDADREIQKAARKRLSVFEDRVRFYSGWSQDFFAECLADGAERPGLVLIDLGVSSFHYEKSGRGFSFRRDEPLDMRIDPERGESAAALIRRLPEREFADLLYQYGGERFSRRIARLVVEERRRIPLESSAVLAELVSRAVPSGYRRGPAHPATRTFQALRIAANGELEKLPALLEAAMAVLKPGGRLGVISFHSGEDRLVKNSFRNVCRPFSGEEDAPGREKSGMRTAGGQPAFRMITRKPVVPQAAEVRRNPASRSAKLRVLEKTEKEEGSNT